eukprot:6070679-Ditylum_brightwellii.AAC.1
MFVTESKKIVTVTEIEIVLIVIMNHPHNIVEAQVARKDDNKRIILLLPVLMIGIVKISNTETAIKEV